MRFFRRKRRRSRVPRMNDSHYQVHKEYARAVITERLAYWNQSYNFVYKRVSIKNQRTCWGSCSEHKNLNFNYKLVLLPESLMDYVIVHELCHLAELSHSQNFWSHVERTLPDYRERRAHLRKMTHVPKHGFPSSVYTQRIQHVN
jgi:hypothetical protein